MGEEGVRSQSKTELPSGSLPVLSEEGIPHPDELDPHVMVGADGDVEFVRTREPAEESGMEGGFELAPMRGGTAHPFEPIGILGARSSQRAVPSVEDSRGFVRNCAAPARGEVWIFDSQERVSSLDRRESGLREMSAPISNEIVDSRADVEESSEEGRCERPRYGDGAN